MNDSDLPVIFKRYQTAVDLENGNHQLPPIIWKVLKLLAQPMDRFCLSKKLSTSSSETLELIEFALKNELIEVIEANTVSYEEYLSTYSQASLPAAVDYNIEEPFVILPAENTPNASNNQPAAKQNGSVQCASIASAAGHVSQDIDLDSGNDLPTIKQVSLADLRDDDSVIVSNNDHDAAKDQAVTLEIAT